MTIAMVLSLVDLLSHKFMVTCSTISSFKRKLKTVLARLIDFIFQIPLRSYIHENPAYCLSAVMNIHEVIRSAKVLYCHEKMRKRTQPLVNLVSVCHLLLYTLDFPCLIYTF